MKTYIIIPYNTQYELTKECVEKIQSSTNPDEVFILLLHAYINEGDKSLDLDVDLHIRFPNSSYCNTINRGLVLVPCTCSYVFIMGNDSFPITEGWLPKLREQLNGSVKVLSPDYTAGGKGSLVFEDTNYWFHTMIPSIHFFMEYNTMVELGYLDERFTGACYYSDDEYCNRVIAKYGDRSLARSKHVLFEHRLSQEGKNLYNISSEMGKNYKIYENIKNQRV